jgi:TPR repeat protein
MSRLAEAVKANDDAASRYRDLEAILTKRSLSINSNSNSSSHDTRLTSNLDWSLLNTVERRKVAEVLRLWKFAADSGLAMAARNLGAALERGAGACWAPSSSGAAALTTTALAEESQHLSDAAAWFLKAAMAGDVDAQVHLATMHTQVTTNARTRERDEVLFAVLYRL